MSLENLDRFIEAAREDSALQQKLSASRRPEELARLAAAAGAERGLSFTAEEFLSRVGPQPGEGSVELSDDQLESVSGGAGWSPMAIAQMFASMVRQPRDQSPGERAKDLAETGALLDSQPPH